MPRSTRDEIKRRFDSIDKALNRALYQLEVLEEQFQVYHPHYAEAYRNLGVMITTAKEFALKLKSFI